MILFGACVGVAATVTMDVLGSFARRLGLAAGTKGQWVGRWYLGIARGQFFIPTSPAHWSDLGRSGPHWSATT